MSKSKLQIAANLLNNPNTQTHQLEDILADIQIVLTTNSGTLDKDARYRYAQMKVLLEHKLDPQKTQEKEAAAEKKAQQYETKQKYFQQKAATKIEVPKIESRPKISLEKITYYSKKEFFPENPKAGDKFWLNYSYLGPSMFNSDDDTSIWHLSGTIRLKGERHPLWIGDLRIDSLDMIPRQGSFGYQLSPETCINATPVIDFDRVEALYSFYSAFEHKPTQAGELGWTRNTPQRATPRLVPTRNRGSLFGQRYDSSSLPLRNVGSNHLLKIGGFVIFVDNISEDDLRQRTVFDIVYSSTSLNGKSGQGYLITNHVRELVTQNIAQYRQLEKEFKQ